MKKVATFAAVAAVTTALSTSSCAQGGAVPQAEAPAAPPPAPFDRRGVFRFQIGALEAMALADGDIQVPNDGTTFGVGQPPEAVGALLAAAGLPTKTLDLGIQPLLVLDGPRTLLFDAGAAGAPFGRGGRLFDSLRAAGVAPSQVTDVFVSHGHQDHIGGLVTSGGALAFPNARIHLSAPEWEAMKGNEKRAAVVAVIAPMVDAFAPGAVLLPSVTAVAAEGHTPGHSAYEILSGTERLLYIGD